MVELGQVSDLSVSETLKPETAVGLFKDITPENEALSYGKRLYMEVKTGLKQGRLVGEDVAWPKVVHTLTHSGHDAGAFQAQRWAAEAPYQGLVRQ